MKSKFKLLSLISVLAVGATMTFTACGDSTVGEHDHEWDEGTVTTEATCYSEGKKTYNCKVEGCEQTKSEPVAMVAHTWNNGEVTKQAKCNKEGVKTYTCTVEGCGKTKEEAVEKTAHRYGEGQITKAPDFLIKGNKMYTCLDCEAEKTETVEAHADFSEQFYTTLTESNNWLYGYANSYDAQTGAVDFVRMTEAEGNAWKTEKTEIGKGYVYSENNAVIAYSFTQEITESVQTNVCISFSGEESATRLNAYLIINGECVELNEDNAKDWSYQTEEAIDIAQGDILYLVFENNGEGKAGGNLSLTLTPPCLHVWDKGTVTEPATCTAEGEVEYKCLSCDKKYTESTETVPHEYDDGRVTLEPTEESTGIRTYTCKHCEDTKTEVIPKLGSSEFNGADYAEDFSTEPQSDWKYGYTNNFNFDTNTFTFNELHVDGEAWVDNGKGIEIKAGWFKNETDGAQAVIRYIMPQTREINIALSFAGSDGNTVTRISGRLHILKPDGTVQSCEFINGNEGSTWTYETKVTVEAGSAISILFFNEGNGGWFHGNLSMILSSECIHSWDDGEVTTAATCHSDGVKTFTCEKCEETKTEAITTRPDHDFTGEWQKDSAAGHYHKCKNEGCDATDTPKAHGWVDAEEIKPATNDEDGIMKTECSVCGRESTRVIPALNHKKGTEYGKDDDNHWFKCSEHDDCGVKFEEKQHEYTEHLTDEDKEVTCEEDGYTVWQCECGKTEQRTVSKDTVDHTYGYTKVDKNEHKVTCSVCGDEKTEAHNWTVTGSKPASMDESGYIDSECDNCGETKREEIPARASFKDEFTLEDQDGAWGYGYMADPWSDDRHFVQSTEKTSEAWTADGVEIKAGWINANGETTIAYTAEKAMTAKITVQFAGSQENTLLAIRIYSVGAENKLTEIAFNNTKNADGKQVAEATYNFEAGATIYVMFSNEHWNGGEWQNAAPNGNLDITLTKQDANAPEFEGASLKDDFTLENQDGAWSYGYVNYHFKDDNNPDDKEDFTFVAAQTKGEFGWTALVTEDEETKVNVDIRSDLLVANKGFATIAYTFSSAVKVNVFFKFTGNGPENNFEEQGKFNIRIGVKHSGTLESAPKFYSGEVVTVEEEMEFAEGDTIYFIIEHTDKGWDSGKPEITITQAE